MLSCLSVRLSVYLSELCSFEHSGAISELELIFSHDQENGFHNVNAKHVSPLLNNKM